MIRVTQFSDCHFTTSTTPTYGGLGYNTTEAWDAISHHAFEGTNPDRVIVTGISPTAVGPMSMSWPAHFFNEFQSR
jgi:hypothetical protein